MTTTRTRAQTGAAARRAGIALEREVKRYLEDNGYFVIRAAGSRGPVDLAAFKPGDVLLVQCKTDGRLTAAEALELWELGMRLRAMRLLAGWHKEGREARTVQFQELARYAGHADTYYRPWKPDYAMED